MARGRRFVVAAGHPAAALAGAEVLRRGGNAIDAGVAAGLCLNVLHPDMTNFGGVAPILLFKADTRAVHSISGLGWWPRRASLAHFRDSLGGQMPAGVLRTVVPAAPDAWLTALQQFGTLRFEDVVVPALELAESGFPVYHQLAYSLRHQSAVFSAWPSTAALYAPGGRTPREGELLVQPDLAQTFRRLVAAERAATRLGRGPAVRAARDAFYRGEIAADVAAFMRAQGGWLDERDLANFSVEVETPPSVDYHGLRVYGTGAWAQGPVLLQALAALDGLDLARLGHNSAEYAHLVAETLLLAFADREAYLGDPRFVQVPLEGLLSADYAAQQRRRVGPRASGMLPEAGQPPGASTTFPRRAKPSAQPRAGTPGHSTSYVCAVDEWGNGFSATPSDTLDWAPVIPGLGIVASPRGIQSRLDADHPSALAPGKRPRLTPSPALATRDGELAVVWGTPGGDVQPQAMLQVLLNLVEFGLDAQQAVEAPRFGTFSFPDSFFPHAYSPGLLRVEGRIDAAVRAELERRGHLVHVWEDLAPQAGGVCLVTRDPNGTLSGGADPRRAGVALAW